MKIFSCLLFITLLVWGNAAFSQNKSTPQTSKGDHVRKGTITFNNGKSEKYKNLLFTNDIVRFCDSKGQIVEHKTSSVLTITKRGNYALLGVLVGGAGGLVAGIQGGKDLNSVDTYFGQKKSDQTPLIIASTAGSAVICGLIGLLLKREFTVYTGKSTMGFYPTINTSGLGQLYPMLSFRMNM